MEVVTTLKDLMSNIDSDPEPPVNIRTQNKYPLPEILGALKFCRIPQEQEMLQGWIEEYQNRRIEPLYIQ